ncbi:winged helix-turn-helix transcriptional regulator [Halorussus gelatinilyticus]|uniref:Winged helix-turn-helix transcriptional regulator n=1 Tax=Halorussus gelatinilyticus TaxID=2937524 RepID=A0A8U0IDF1_9EURY|nr:Lrp/AsnC family transcriptional regulator [Halorussus gelatinilyticus]UPV98794.1 winged helix-turn-helix transcriptional regulator [Halorussus gelatinilyticus]
MSHRVDEIDKRILYHLAADARNTSAPTIAEEVDVTPATIRHRIRQMEEAGIIEGYHADIDYERTDGRIVNQFTCTAPVADRHRLAQAALQVSGVVNVRKLMAGRENLVVTAVGTDTDDVTRIARELSNHGLDLEREDIVQDELYHPYHPFGAEDEPSQSFADVQNLAGGAEVIEFTVPEDAAITGRTLEDANESGVIDDDSLVISIERGDAVLTPRGDTAVEAGDVVTLFAPESVPEGTVEAFETRPSERVADGDE